MSTISKLIFAEGGLSRKMKAADYFIENNAQGYGTKEEMLEYFKDDSNNDRFEGVLEFMFEGVPFNNLPVVLIDKNDGHEFTFVRPALAKGNPAVPIKLVGRLINFIKDYQIGRISPAFTLAELYEEACKENVASV